MRFKLFCSILIDDVLKNCIFKWVQPKLSIPFFSDNNFYCLVYFFAFLLLVYKTAWMILSFSSVCWCHTLVHLGAPVRDTALCSACTAPVSHTGAVWWVCWCLSIKWKIVKASFHTHFFTWVAPLFFICIHSEMIF